MTGRVLLFVLFFAGSVSAQFDGQSIVRRIVVHVVFSNGGPCDASTRVTLAGIGGPAVSESPNRDCEAEFVNLPSGTYQLSVSGLNFSTVDAGSIPISPAGQGEVEVKVDRAGSAGRTDGAPASAFVAVADLNIPSSARKEFDKANELIAKQDFAKAIQRLNKAIAIYPAYTGAYNNLAVIYSRLGDGAQEREALQKAISTNDHFAAGYVNLGRMNIRAGNFPEAEAALSKASSLDPSNTMTMVLLTYVEFMNRHLDQAIATSRKAHSLPQGQHALVHTVAAKAFEEKHDAVNAIAELELFLKEEQTGPRAETARKELASLQAGPR
ncbi:MAG TPA: tetratricopeptide repeat protein [Acidobacteriota bacterium]|nr:tetratricopeptide repeat protein [Acidobacteriota bacterium]